MLAKVVKNISGIAIQPVAFPELGAVPSGAAAPSFIDSLPAITRAETGSAATAVAPAFEMPRHDATENEPAPDADRIATEIIAAAQAEAAEIIANAEMNAAAVAEAACEKALTELELRLAEENEAKSDELRLTLTRTIEQISALAETISAKHEHDIVELAIHIARKVVAREVTIDREIAFTLVKVSLAKLHARAVAEVHLHPDDLVFVESHRERLDFRGALELIADRSISPGGCLIHTETGDIDGRIESQFDEITHGLLVS
jgi:flagellar assembly protein FliH